MSFTECDVIKGEITSQKYDCVTPTIHVNGSDERRSARALIGSGMSASSEDTSDSGFFQIVPDGIGLSPRPSRSERRLSGQTDCTDAEDIDFFLKVVGEFRDYVTEKIEALEEQHKVNEGYLGDLQTTLKESENNWTDCEVKIVREISQLVALLHQKQNAMIENVKVHRSKGTDSLREKMDVCRRNMKIISGVLSFARRVKNENDDTIRENTLKELKQRFQLANERTLPPMEDSDISNQELGLMELSILRNILQRTSLESVENDTEELVRDLNTPKILAQASHSDVTSHNVIIRWTVDNGTMDNNSDVIYEVFWEYIENGMLEKRNVEGITDTYYVISDLYPNCDVTVRVQAHSSAQSSDISQPACFKCSPQPAKFTLDSDTAHAKLQISPDLYSVYYPGESGSAISKSPARFSFALNVLGSISFYTGKHYWEVLVNKDGWAVGVSYRSVPRNSWLGSNDSSWILHFNPSKHEYKVRHAGESDDINMPRGKTNKEMGRIGIYLDYEAGIISFLDCHHKDVLYTFNTGGFREPVCAAVNPFYHGGALTIISGLETPDIDFTT